MLYFFFPEITTASHLINSKLYTYILYNNILFSVYTNQLLMQPNNQSIKIVLKRVCGEFCQYEQRGSERTIEYSYKWLCLRTENYLPSEVRWSHHSASHTRMGKTSHTRRWAKRKEERLWGLKYLVVPNDISFYPKFGWFWEPPIQGLSAVLLLTTICFSLLCFQQWE